MGLLLARRGAIAAARNGALPVGGGYYDEVLADNPIGLWKLDEPSGATAADSSGNSRDATYIGATLDQAGPSAEIPKSILTDGTDDKVWTPLLAAFNIPCSGTWSVEAWIKTTSTDPTLAAQSWRDDSGVSARVTAIIYLNRPSAGGVSLGLATTGGSFMELAVGSLGSNDGNWHHVVGTAVSGGSARLYFDGSEVGSKADARNSAGSDRRMRLGTNDDSQWFPGNIAAPAFYDSTLPPARILTHFNAAALA